MGWQVICKEFNTGLTEGRTPWNVKSDGPKEASLQPKLVEEMEFQLSYFKS